MSDTLDKVLSNFKPHKDYQIDKYYGVSLYKRKSDGMYYIALIHDFVNGNAINSSVVKLSKVEKAVEIYVFLDSYSQDNRDKENLDDIVLAPIPEVADTTSGIVTEFGN